MAITLLNLRDRARARADQENSEFVSDSELNRYINDGYKKLYRLMVDSFTDWFVKDTPTNFTISSGATHPLATDFYKLWGVDIKIGGRWKLLRSFMPLERNREALHRTLTGYYDRVKYRLMGNVLRFTPEDDALNDYRYWYVPTVTELSSDSDAISSILERSGWHELIELSAAIKMVTKEESDPSFLIREEQMLIAEIKEQALNRDLSEPQRIQDVERFEDDDDSYLLRW